MLPSLRARAQRSLEYIRLHNDFVACVDQFAPLHEVHSVDEVSIELSPTDHPVQFMDNLPETVDAVLGERASGPGAFAEPTSPHACQKGLVTSDRHIPMSASRWSLRVPSSRRQQARACQVRTVANALAIASSSFVPASACASWGR